MPVTLWGRYQIRDTDRTPGRGSTFVGAPGVLGSTVLTVVGGVGIDVWLVPAALAAVIQKRYCDPFVSPDTTA